ncbi:zinc finger protein 416 [Anabrus simplex]|uniref:zinc finger protein 416 n=1 Tax=Anabrus simplex TaxID=316456 RepID=UPI0034DD6A2E
MANASLCRLCAVQKDSFVGIYEEEGHKLNLETKITKCLQIEVCPKDPLPKCVCLDCCAKLNQCSDFIETSSQAQVALHMIYLQPKKEEEPVDQSEPLTEEEPADNDDQEDQSSSQEEEAVTDPDPPEFVECVLSDGQGGAHQKGDDGADDTSSSKRKRRMPVRCASKVKAAVGDTRESCRPEAARRTGKAKMEETQEATQEVENESASAQAQLAEPSSPRKRRDGWEKYPWMCTDCSQELPTMQALRTHHQTVHNQPPRFMCAQCSKVYTKYYGFVSHVRRHRNHMKFCCEECGKCFSNKKVLESHRATHSDARPFACSECGKTFRQQSALYVHNRSHQPDNIKNRYPCDQCDKRFSTKPNLVTHKRIHTGIRNFTCDQCGKSFIQKGNLDAHLLTHSLDKPHMCPICNKGFKTPLQLRKHQSVHTGAKPHQCDVCGRQFRERGTLREHHRIHTGAMPFTCEFCGKQFRFKGILTTHRRQHTGERPYSCLECQHHFTNWPNYNKHMKRRHGINTSHQPDPNKIALANMAAAGVPQPPVMLSPEPQPAPLVQYNHHHHHTPTVEHETLRERGGAHFYNPAPAPPMGTYVSPPQVPSSMLGFYNLPQLPGMDPTSTIDMLHSVQQR